MTIAQRALDEEVHDRDADVGQQQRRDRFVDAARVAEIARDRDPDRRRRRRRPRRSWMSRVDKRRHDAHHRNRHRRGGEAAEHQRAFAADDDQPDAGGDGDASAVRISGAERCSVF